MPKRKPNGELKCGHRVYITPGLEREWFDVGGTKVFCPTCGTTHEIVSMDGPESLSNLFQIGG